MIRIKYSIYLSLLFMLLGNTLYSQPKQNKIYIPYREVTLVINKIPKNDRVPFEEADILLFENNSLFEGIRYIKVNHATYFIPENIYLNL